MGSRNAEVAQLVEYLPSKQTVASSSLVFRSIFFMATWPSGKAEACKAFTPGSNPGVAFCLFFCVLYRGNFLQQFFIEKISFFDKNRYKLYAKMKLLLNNKGKK